ncbi:methionyl-tRNA formyltransferase [Candidatus Kaiserbacteria bacterium]|nr:methionyl-tRNA formyltransferase [Candidatus Kaiserbacteria bacterium]
MTNPKKESEIRFAFFGTSRIAVGILDELERENFIPALIVAAPDARKGRGMNLTSPPTKEWASAHDVPTLQPDKLDSDFLRNMRVSVWDVFVVVDYGRILPKLLLDVPRRGCLNVHFSLLPRYRGASPIRSAILNNDKNIGTSIILLVEKLDEGPIIAQKALELPSWPMKASALEDICLRESGQLLARILPAWVAGEIDAREQNHDLATYCEKIKKEDGLLDLSRDPYHNLLKVYAYEGWPSTYSFFERSRKKIRVQILDAHIEDGTFIVDRVKPEGKRDMSYQEFSRSGAKPI